MPTMRAITLGKIYIHPMRLPIGRQRFNIATTQETSPPYRRGKGLMIRVFGDWRVAIGVWTKSIPDEETALMLAMHGRVDKTMFEDGRLAERFVRKAALEKVAANADSLDDEWRIVDALGLLEDVCCECGEDDCDGRCDEDGGGLIR